MNTIDPATGKSTPLPDTAVQRVLYIHPSVHCYAVPPLTSNKGYSASQWLTQPPIFTARLRIIETALPASGGSKGTTSAETVYTNILLEDASTGDLFAGAPYTNPTVVAQCVDSSRFFAVRVVGEGGRKATLGVGFEERSDAFDFGIALQDAGKVLGLEAAPVGAQGRASVKPVPKALEVKRDYSLKEGETITVNIPSRMARKPSGVVQDDVGEVGGAMPFLPPPPSAADVRRDMDDAFGMSSTSTTKQSAEELGFDDGEFGEFQ